MPWRKWISLLFTPSLSGPRALLTLPLLPFPFFYRSNTTHTYKTSGGRPGIGMGLQQSMSGPGVSTGTREILGRLEIGEGGDVKRTRR